MKPERKQELADLVTERIMGHIENEFWEYHNWDDAIECDESITDKDLEWMREHVKIEVKVTV